MSASSCSVGEVAYTKIMLHAAAYPHCAVDGLCLGTVDGSAIAIADVVPLFHNGTLAPMLEAASHAAHAYASASGAKIVGYYAANEHLRDESISAAATGIATEIAAKGGSAIVVQVSNKRLADPTDHGLNAYGKAAGGSYAAPCAVKCAPSSKFLTALDAGVHIVDFDAHLDDVTADWRNPQVSAWLAAN